MIETDTSGLYECVHKNYLPGSLIIKIDSIDKINRWVLLLLTTTPCQLPLIYLLTTMTPELHYYLLLTAVNSITVPWSLLAPNSILKSTSPLFP